MTLKDFWLPIARHVRDLLVHSEEMVSEKSERGLKIGLILADNAAEISLREYLVYYKNFSVSKVEDFSFHELLQNSQGLGIVNTSLPRFKFFHITRNLLYHNGSLIPSEQDVLSAISLAKELFNELHPDHMLPIHGNILPSMKTIKKIRDQLLVKDQSINEVYFATLFDEKLKRKGYDTNFYFGTPHFIFDMIATKQEETILIEFKSRADAVSSRILRFLSEAREWVRNDLKSERVAIWLVGKGLFSGSIHQEAASRDIELIDDSNIQKI